MICSSVNRLGFMSIPLTGDGLYSFLEEILGLRSGSVMSWFTPTNLLWVFGHLVLVLIGILLIAAGVTFGVSKELAEALGSGVLATGIAGEVLFLYVARSDSTRARLELFTQAGLLKIFPHRSVRMRDEYDSRLRDAREIDVLGFGQSSFRQDYSSQFQQLAAHARIRVILLDPDYPSGGLSLAEIRDKEEGNRAGQIRNDVEEFIRTTKQIAGLDRTQFKVRIFRAIPSISFFRIDDVIFWGPYLITEQSRNTPTLLVQRGGFLFERLKQHFDHIWDSADYSSAVDF
jgi:hypothetical protein